MSNRRRGLSALAGIAFAFPVLQSRAPDHLIGAARAEAVAGRHNLFLWPVTGGKGSAYLLGSSTSVTPPSFRSLRNANKLYTPPIRTGDAMAALIANRTEEPQLQLYFDEIFGKRNERMAQIIEGYLNTPYTYFVVVGAGHLVGDRGILGLLQENGYRVDQLTAR